MRTSDREPQYLVSEDAVAAKSPIAAGFLQKRREGNAAVERLDDSYYKRFFNLDHNAYLEGAVPAKYKELMGLTGSAVLRCDDCIYYHIIQAFRLGANQVELTEALKIGLIIGGSIVIPHLRRAHQLVEELFPVKNERV